jgi:D-sedoheptulose 7-phosphate isomerase
MGHMETMKEMLEESNRVKEKVIEECLDDMVKAVAILLEAFKKGNKVLIFGNGGSASDSQHIACEFVSKFRLERDGLPAIALTTDTSILTAIPNDYDFNRVFKRQVEALGAEGDVAIGLSTSGNSPNVLEAVAEAKRKGMRTIALCGAGGKLKDAVDVSINVPSTDTPRIQESHIAIGHILCDIVEKELFG